MSKKEFQDAYEFSEVYPTVKEQKEALRDMSNKEIDKLIAACGIARGKIYYSKFMK